MSTLRTPPTTDIVSAIYDAALDPSRWPDVVAELASWQGGELGCVQVRRLQPHLGVSCIATGQDPTYMRAYREHYFRLDPHLARVDALPAGRTTLSREVLPDEELFKTPYFNEYCLPQRLIDLQGAMLIRDESRVVTFAAFGSQRQRFDEQTRARLDAVVPHLTRALKLTLRAEDLAGADLALRSAARAQRSGLLRVDATLRVLEATPGVLDWLGCHLGSLSVRDGQLMLRDAGDAETVRCCVHSALAGASVHITLQADADEALPLWVSPAPPSLLHPEAAAFVVFSVQPRNPAGATPQQTCIEALPPALRPVAALLAAGLSDKEIAERLELPLATARTYVFRALRKLGVSSRRELIARK